MRQRLAHLAIGCLAAFSVLGESICASDWPAYKHDARRSGVTSDTLAFPLHLAWAYEPSQRPAPAWPEPGKELHRLDFDYAFQPVAAGGMIYFGSSADDTLRALDAASGERRWLFTTGGPIRFAPAVAGGMVYVGSDDGCLYCLDAHTGRLAWRFRGAPGGDRLLGNGRMISRWPLRSGALVVDGVAYFTAGMWPTQGVYVYALDAQSGKQRWCNDSSGSMFINLPHCGSSAFSGVTPQGYLLASSGALLVPTGRSVPAAFDRRTGRLLYYRPAKSTKDGGSWVTATDALFFNPANPSWWHSHAHVGEAQPRHGDGMIGYSIATGEKALRLGDRYRVLIAADVIYAARVNGTIEALDRRALLNAHKWVVKWSAPHGRVYSMALAGRALLVGGSDSVTAFDVSTGKSLWRSDVAGQVRGMAVANGRLVAATNRGSLVCFEAGPGAEAKLVKERASAPAVPKPQVALAADIVKTAGVSEGYALVVGQPDASLALALAMQTRLHVIAVLPDAASARAERERLLPTGLYGTRLAVEGLADKSRLPYASYFASLVVVLGDGAGLPGRELYRVVRPCGGKLLLRGVDAARSRALIKQSGAPAKEASADGRLIVRGALPGAGEWRHQWADAGRTGIGAESRVHLPLELLWFGGPGPDRMMDRTGASPPLSVAGRVFVTGERDVICLDAYTGRELWVRGVKNAGRIGVRRTSSNFAADDDCLYLATGHECFRLDQATGKTLATYAVPAELTQAEGQSPAPPNGLKLGTDDDQPANMGWGWGYLSVTDDLVLGSHRMPILYTKKLHGMIPWWFPRYSDAVFALDKRTGATRWVHRAQRGISGVDIALGDGKLFFLDATPNLDFDGRAKRRGEQTVVKRSLVALKLDTGAVAWRQDDVPALSRSWSHVQHAKHVVVVGANAAYDADTGRKLWQRTGGPSRPPLIYGDWVIDMPCAHDLRTGEYIMTTDPSSGRKVPWRFMRSRGCGLIVGCRNLLFFRGAALGFFDVAAEGFTSFGGVRPNCAASIIAANGLVIAPEASSGCECSYNYQTSLALVPARDRGDAWVAMPDLAKNRGPIRYLRVNLGAPGDRWDKAGLAWLGFPRLGIRSQRRAAAPVTVLMDKPVWRYSPSKTAAIHDADRAWVYTSSLRGQGKIAIELIRRGDASRSCIAVPTCDSRPRIDGKLDDACWRDAKPVAFAGNAHLEEPRTTLFIRRDANALYFAYRRDAVLRDGKPLPFVARHSGDDAKCWDDDEFEIFLTDHHRRQGIRFGISAAGGRFDAFSRRISAEAKDDIRWQGEWTRAVQRTPKAWVAEVAIPLATLSKAKLNVEHLKLNCMSQNLCGRGLERIYLCAPDLEFYRCRHFLAIVDQPPPSPPERTFTVRLHFAETDDVTPGQRVFDVAVQGKTVITGLDIVKEAGGRNVPLVKEVRGIKGSDMIVVALVSRSPTDAAPVLNGIEVLEEN